MSTRKWLERKHPDTYEELNFGDDFKKLCEYRHKWDDGWVCSKCGVRKADWVEGGL